MPIVYVIIFIVCVAGFLKYLFPVLSGAPYLPTHRALIDRLLQGVSFEGKTVADIGSGDGRIVIALAKAGARSYGYEINPILVWWTKRKIKKERLEGRAHVMWADMWKEDFSRFDIVIVFGIPHIMKQLEEKLRKELNREAVAVSNAFQFPTWRYEQKHQGGWYLYRK